MEFVTFAQYWEMSDEQKQQIKQNLNELQVDYLEPEVRNASHGWDVDSMKDQYIPIGIEQYGSMDEKDKNKYYESIEAEARSNLAGYGSLDDPAYCDMNSHCYSHNEDANCADSYIKELRLNREEYEIMKQSYEELKKESDELSDKCIQAIEEKQKLRKENKELKETISNKQDYIDKLECGQVVFECAECDELKAELEYKKNCWDPMKVCRDLLENTKYRPDNHGEFVNYIQLLEKENKKIKQFCQRGRVAERNSPLEEMYLREAGLMFNDDNELVVKY